MKATACVPALAATSSPTTGPGPSTIENTPDGSSASTMHSASFTAQIEVARAEGGEDWVDGRSILSLLSLAAGRGTRLRVRAEGEDAADAVEALGRLLEGHGAAPETVAGGGTSG